MPFRVIVFNYDIFYYPAVIANPQAGMVLYLRGETNATVTAL